MLHSISRKHRQRSAFCNCFKLNQGAVEALEWKDLRQGRLQFLVPCANGGGLRDSSLSEILGIVLRGLIPHDSIDFIPKSTLRNRVKPNCLSLSQIDPTSVGIQEYRSVN